MALELKYFVLKPKSKFKCDMYAYASRMAMRTYAEEIEETDHTLAQDLLEWANIERKNEENLV